MICPYKIRDELIKLGMNNTDAAVLGRTIWAKVEKYAKYPWDKCMSDCRARYSKKFGKNTSERCRKICGSIKAKYGGSEIDYTALAKDLMLKGKIYSIAKHISAEIAARIILHPYSGFSECVHDQMKKHNMSKADAIKRCKVFAAKGIHGGIPSKKKKKELPLPKACEKFGKDSVQCKEALKRQKKIHGNEN